MTVLLPALIASVDVEAEGDPEYGAYLAGTCVTCHGGEAPGIPSLDHLSYEDFIRALAEYRDETRSNAAMVSVARGLGEEEIEALAAFYTQQE
jgi:cytochrome c